MEERILLKVSFNGNDAGSFITVKAFLPSAIVLLTTAWPLIDIRECPTVREREGEGGRGREGIEGGERGERGEREGRERGEGGRATMFSTISHTYTSPLVTTLLSLCTINGSH